MAILALLLIIAGFTILPLYLGFWPVTIVAASVVTLVSGVYAYAKTDSGVDGLGGFILAVILTGCVWFGVGLAGLISIFI